MITHGWAGGRSEARYAPHFLALQGSSLPDARAVVATVAAELRACHAAAREQGGGGAVLVKQILCCVNLSPELSAEVVRAAEEFGGAGDGAVVGVDLACGEHHFENAAVFAEHRAAMRRARDAGLGVTVHAGESGGAANVRAAPAPAFAPHAALHPRSRALRLFRTPVRWRSWTQGWRAG